MALDIQLVDLPGPILFGVSDIPVKDSKNLLGKIFSE
uniref:Uncharacterized protein n=1 Tax=Vitis vinifera TaxID=29760 RepID=F6GY29_VITVI